MSERIQPDFSVKVNMGGESVLINRVYDNIHLFDWLGHSILKIVSEEGFLQWHTSYDNGVAVANSAGITPVHRPEITPQEYEQYLQYVEHTMDDSWIDGTE